MLLTNDKVFWAARFAKSPPDRLGKAQEALKVGSRAAMNPEWYSDGMSDSQIAQIKALEETVRQLGQQVAELREMANNTNDMNLRKTLLKAADECETGAQNLANGLRGMREKLQ